MISNPDDLEHKQQQAWEDRAEESGSDEGEDDDDGDFEAGDEGEEEVSSSCQCRQPGTIGGGCAGVRGHTRPRLGPRRTRCCAPCLTGGLMQASIFLVPMRVEEGKRCQFCLCLYTVAAGRR